MSIHLRRLMSWAALGAAAWACVLSAPRDARAQAEPIGFRFSSGQDIQPIFEGWSRNPDGSFSMHFGYANRNYVEQLSVPIGPDNNIMPGGPDRGQPTFFYARIRRRIFSVKVPKDWGPKSELVWTLTVRGKTEKAVAWLQPEWEIDPIRGGQALTPELRKNTAPTMTVDVPSTVTLPNTVKLAANVVDDGLPVPRKDPPKPAVGQETPPTLKPPPDQPEMPVNVPQIQGASPRGQRNRPQGLAVTWTVWRGPADVTFEPGRAEVKDGKAVVTATFTKPGAYVLRAIANDGALTDQKDVGITVNGPSQ